MKILAWICWFRGWHISFYKVDAFVPAYQAADKRDNLYGKVSPCEMCGNELAEGTYRENTWIKLVWRKP